MYQQSSFQGGQSFGAGQNRYQPAGFVQSQYQGQLSRSAASGPVTAKFGYQAGQQQSFGAQPIGQQQFTGQAGSFQTSSFARQPADQHPVYRATNAYQQEGPVIQQLGYQAGVQQNFRQPVGQQQFAGQTVASSFGAQQQWQQHPVYTATNARQQDGPVIQQLGYQAGAQQNFRQPVGQQQFAGQTAASSFAQTQQHPVYNATNARQQEGPVIQQLGYQAGAQNKLESS